MRFKELVAKTFKVPCCGLSFTFDDLLSSSARLCG